MTRDEYVALYLGVFIKKSNSWLPEEAPEEMFLEITHQRQGEHVKEILEVLKRNGEKNNP